MSSSPFYNRKLVPSSNAPRSLLISRTGNIATQSDYKQLARRCALCLYRKPWSTANFYKACALQLLLCVGLASIPMPACAAFLPAQQTAASESAPQGAAQSARAMAQSNPEALMRKASQNDLEHSYAHHAPLRYRIRKITPKSDTTKEIVETAGGGVARLVAVDGHPLSPLQEQTEIKRLQTLEANPALQEHRRNKELHDAAQIREIMRLLPDAFLYRFVGTVATANGKLLRLTFTPNPKFSPPDLESRILTGICGDVWIDPVELRVVHIEGRLFRRVDYGWGLLGVLDPGGSILIEQSRTSAAGWQLAHLKLDFHGKALLVKSLHVATYETATDYQSVPRDWNYKDAVRWLLQMSPTAAMPNKNP